MNAPSPARPVIEFSRRGACPALSVPMRTGDGLLVRLNPLSAGLPPATLIGLCALAIRHGNGIVEVTARGSFQIRGLTDTSASLLAREVDAMGIAIRTGVPVQTAPLAGLDLSERADPRPLAAAIRAGIDARGLNKRLGPKVSVVIDGGGHSALASVAGDVRLTAIDRATWQMAIGGDAAGATPVGAFGQTEAGEAALTILTAIADRGLTARGRDLAVASFLNDLRSTLPPSVLPDISPTRGEINLSDVNAISGESHGANAIAASVISLTRGKINLSDVNAISGESHEANTIAASVISPPVGEMSGRTEGGAKEHNAPSLHPGTAIPLTDTRHALPIALPFGSSHSQTLIAFLRTAEAQGVAEVRLAPGRQVLLFCASQPSVAALRNEAATLGFITSAADPRAHVAACPGAPACASAYLPARDIALRAAEALGDRLSDTFTLHVSGCAKGCARQEIATLTIVGDEKGAGCVARGTAKDRPLAYTQPDAAVEGLVRVAALLAGDKSSDAGKLAGAFERA
jgi:precorrin-3B synthase